VASTARALHQIGQDLTGLPERESLLRAAVSYLRHDLSYDGARIALKGARGQDQPSLRALFTVGGPTIATIPVRLGPEVFGELVIPLRGNSKLSKSDKDILETFAGFLAVGLGNIRRLEEVRALASIDPLTGVMNRRRLFELGSQHVTRTKPTGLIVFDVDRLKMINDNLGHLAGDALLKSVAERAKACIRKTDFLARYGGDEFVILLPNTESESVHEVAERIRTYIESTTVEWRGHTIRSTISVGFACIEGDVDIYDLLGRADEALYAAKQAGRNLVRSQGSVPEPAPPLLMRI
jgi:diguanylate cyclase (GGDEF)-like protein